MNTRKGFTLVELLVVIAILAILATVSVVGYTSFIQNANNSAAKQELAQLRDKVIADDILNDDVTLGQSTIVLTVEADDNTTEDDAKELALEYFENLTGLAGEIVLTVEDTESVKEGAKIVAYTVTISEVQYTKGEGSATWTVKGNTVE